MSDEQSRPGFEPPVNPRVPLGLESHFELVRLEWLYRIASKITETLKPYHERQRGDTVGRDTNRP